MANSLVFNYVDAAKKSSIDKALTFIDAIKDVSVIAYDDTEIKGELSDVSAFAHGIHIPENASELANDAGYLVADDVSAFVTSEELDSKGFLTEHQSLDAYARTADINIHLSNLDASVEAALDAVKDDVSSYITSIRGEVDAAVVNVEGYTDDKVLALNNDLTAIINANRTTAASDLEYAIARVRGDVDASIGALDIAKQDKFEVGAGLALDNGVLSSTIDTTLFRIVNELPTVDIEDNKIYLVSTHNSTVGDIYTEHIHTQDGWEKLGEFKATTDLSGYYTKNEIDSTILTTRQALEATIANNQNDNNLKHIEIDGNIAALQDADVAINTLIDEKFTVNSNAITALSGTVADHKAITDVNTENISAHDASIAAIIETEANDYSTLSGLIVEINNSIGTANGNIQANTEAIATEVGNRQDAINTLTDAINEKANADDVSLALSGKADAADFETLTTVVQGKANADDVYTKAEADELFLTSADIEEKANIEDVSTALAEKANTSEVEALHTAIASKADAASIESLALSIQSKADAADLEALSTTVQGKADAADVSDALAAKANATDLNDLVTTVQGKANADDVSLALSGKADAGDFETLTTVVQAKANAEDVSAALAEKAAASDVESLLENDADQDASITEIKDTIAGLWNIEEESISYDYIYDEASWVDSFENGVLKKYYEKYPDEDLYNVETGAAATFNDKQYVVEIYSDADAQNLVNTADYKAGWVSTTVQKITGVVDNSIYFIPKDATKDGKVYELFTDNAMTTSAGQYIKITGVSYPGFSQSWNGAVTAPGAKFPWICPNFDEDVNCSLKFRYEGLEDVLPWSYKIFGKATGHKEWGIASVAEEFENNSFLIPANQNNGKASWDGTAGDNSFDISKFKLILVKPDAPESVKVYINSLLVNYASKSSHDALEERVEALEGSDSDLP